ncbi:hypothetical protein RI367_008529 [Sorochytrium milnesiophthora]
MIRSKIGELQSSHTQARDWRENTGAGVINTDDPQAVEKTIHDILVRKCKYCDTLHPVMRDRANARPLVRIDSGIRSPSVGLQPAPQDATDSSVEMQTNQPDNSGSECNADTQPASTGVKRVSDVVPANGTKHARMDVMEGFRNDRRSVNEQKQLYRQKKLLLLDNKIRADQELRLRQLKLDMLNAKTRNDKVRAEPARADTELRLKAAALANEHGMSVMEMYQFLSGNSSEEQM